MTEEMNEPQAQTEIIDAPQEQAQQTEETVQETPQADVQETEQQASEVEASTE